MVVLNNLQSLNQPRPIKVKVLILGDANVGKTSIAEKYVWNQFNEQRLSTIGVDFISKTIQKCNQAYQLNLWETVGLERYKALTAPLFYRNTDICILTFAVNDRTSFKNLAKWRSDFIKHGNIRNNKFPFILVGNKADIPESERQVSTEEVLAWCVDNCHYYLETSAKDGTNIEKIFEIGFRGYKLRRI